MVSSAVATLALIVLGAVLKFGLEIDLVVSLLSISLLPKSLHLDRKTVLIRIGRRPPGAVTIYMTRHFSDKRILCMSAEFCHAISDHCQAGQDCLLIW